MLFLKCIGLVMVIIMIAGCSATSYMQVPIIGVSHKVHVDIPEHPPPSTRVMAKHCKVKTTFPFYWRVEMNDAVHKALSKAPGAIALSDATVTQKVNFFLIYSRFCTEVSGQPLYASSP